MDSQNVVLMVASLALSLSVHESAHAYVASINGDRTAQRQGRISLNPIDHIDPIGTLLVPALMLMTTGIPFGWAKPVPVNPGNLRNPRRDRALVAAAGPGANIALAIISIIICAVFAPALNDQVLPLGTGLGKLLIFNTIINVILAVFNLIPIGPLDGSGVLEYFLSRRTVRWLRENRMTVTIMLFAFIMLGFFGPIIGFFQTLALRLQMGLIQLFWGYDVAVQIMQFG